MKKKIWEHIIRKSKLDVLEWKKCKVSNEEFPIFQKEADLLGKISPYINGKKYKLPIADISPDVRKRKLLMWRNERSLYKRKCDLTGKSIVSVFSPEYRGKVYDFKEFGGDNWDFHDYGRDYDFSETAMENFQRFFEDIPKRSVNLESNLGLENCDYCNYGLYSKNCYMCQCPAKSQDSFYSFTPLECNYSVDSYLCSYSEIVYESIHCGKCFKVFYCQDLTECSECYFCYDLRGCKNCIGCIGLVGKENYIFNKQVSNEEFKMIKKEIFLSYKSLSDFKKKFDTFSLLLPKRATNNLMSEKCYGNRITGSNELINCYDAYNQSESVNCSICGLDSHHDVDGHSFGPNINKSTQIIGASSSSNSISIGFSSSNYSMYLYDCRFVENCVLSSGIHDTKLHILNKQYGETEYINLAEKIIRQMKDEGMWGEFFPTELCPFPYNDSISNDYYPPRELAYLDERGQIRNKEIYDETGEGVMYILEPTQFISKAILDLGGEEKLNMLWRTTESNSSLPKNLTELTNDEIPEISDIDNEGIFTDSKGNKQDIFRYFIVCSESGLAYKLVKSEFGFYKKYQIPLPRLHPEVRFKQRYSKTADYKLFLRNCKKCNEEILTSWKEGEVICDICEY